MPGWKRRKSFKKRKKGRDGVATSPGAESLRVGHAESPVTGFPDLISYVDNIFSETVKVPVVGVEEGHVINL